MRQWADLFVEMASYCRGHQPERFWTLAWLFGHNGQTDSAMTAFKLKVSAVKGQNLGLDLCFSSPFHSLYSPCMT